MNSTELPPGGAPYWACRQPASGRAAPQTRQKRRLALILLISGLLFQQSATTLPAGPETSFSPLEMHRRVRAQLLAGRDPSAAIRQLEAQTGDRSFEALLSMSSRRLAALRREEQGREAWLAGNHSLALRHFEAAVGLLRSEKADSELAICLLYAAEILADLEKFQASLRVLEDAVRLAEGRPWTSLQALLSDSRGYSLWYLDRLQDSVTAFTTAAEKWRRLGCRPGLAASWNNLGLLYTEMLLFERADYCYRKALDFAGADVDREIRFYLHCNYAEFLGDRGRNEQARAHLAEARRLKSVSPGEFLLLECQVLGVEARLEELAAFRPQLPSLQIEKALLLGRHCRSRGDPEAFTHFRTALALSGEHRLRYHRRQAAIALGRWLESQGRYREAVDLYLTHFEHEENLHAPEFLFPYSRAVSPLFDGWIRCLVRLGDPEAARNGIRRLVRLRRLKAEMIGRQGLWLDRRADEISQLSAVARLEAGTRVESSLEHKEWTQSSPGESSTAAGARLATDAVEVEMWPDGDTVYTWLRSRHGSVFVENRLPFSLNEAVERAVGPFYSAADRLPSWPPNHDLRQLSEGLFEPLRPYLVSRHLVLTAHKELQGLPFEALLSREGRFLVEDYDFSYVPSPDLLETRSPISPQASPLVLLPTSQVELPAAREEESFFRSLFPEARVARSLDAVQLRHTRWLHVAAHFRLDPRIWLASGFSEGTQERSILGVLGGTLDCSLMSLGVCDAGNGFSSRSPYWLGFAELFLARGVQALIVSRWRMDELSSRVYQDFYLACRQGVPMNEALAQARRNFLGRVLRRGAHRVNGRHPFFWAGIAYVGAPGRRLYEPAQTWLPFAAGLVLLAGCIGASVCLSRRASHRRV